MQKDIKSNILIVTGFILLASIFRFIPHPPNFTPILSIALFSGLMYNKKIVALLVPITIMLFTDLIIGFHSTMFFVYASIILITAFGFVFKSNNLKNTVIGAFLSSILFFVVTNFGAWLAYDFYPKTFSGLILSYEMAIPFFTNTLVSTLVYSTALCVSSSLALKSFEAKLETIKK